MKKNFRFCILIIVIIINHTILEADPKKNIFSQITYIENNNNIIYFNNIGINIIETPIQDSYLYAFPPYPSPAKDEVNLKLYWDTNSNFNYSEIDVYNINGIKICGKEKILIEKLADYFGILTWFPNNNESGIYFICIKHGVKKLCVKILIE